MPSLACQRDSASQLPFDMVQIIATKSIAKCLLVSRVCSEGHTRVTRVSLNSPCVQVAGEFELDADERLVFETLLAARQYHGLKTTLRCAGGWVRDKLIGRASRDIDIAIDDMTGAEFGGKVAEYQKAMV